MTFREITLEKAFSRNITFAPASHKSEKFVPQSKVDLAKMVIDGNT